MERDQPRPIPHVIEQTATGSGGYEGLTYVTTIEGTDFPWTLAGLIEPTR